MQLNKDTVSPTTQREMWRKTHISLLASLAELHPENRLVINDLKQRIANQQVCDHEISDEMSKVGRCILNEQDQRNREYRLVASEIKTTLKTIGYSKHLSAEQRKEIEGLNLNDGESASDALSSIGKLCKTFADESIKLRESSSIVVGEGHKHIQQQSGNIIAGDISWSSKQIIKSLLPLLKRVNIEFPGRAIIQENLHKAKTLSSQTNVDFFEALSVMEGTTREVTLLQGARDELDAQYLKNFHQHLKLMHTSLRESLSCNEAFSNENAKASDDFLKALDNFKDASETENDPVKLKDLISKNLHSLNSNFNKVMSQQAAHIKKQNRLLSNLEEDMRLQSDKYTKAIETQRKLKSVIDGITASALIDHLTGVPNRHAYEKSIKAVGQKLSKLELKHYERFGLCVIDVDNFKRINDEHGHVAGDRVLKVVASVLKETLLKLKVSKYVDVFRYGGEEFVLLYKNISLTEASKLTELLRKKIARTPVKLENNKVINLTFSAGVASFTPLDTEGEKVFKTADNAMYRAKKNGKNRTIISQKQTFKYLIPTSNSAELKPVSV
ncbi:hypothetical protein BM525_21500 (plasmid) [Alteromonas mediterranea]|uniref:diguanylate cyclase n=1 Tax=Alteromonas mediterranea TaxID=314275 RepID=A0AAC9JHU7_9ALTE|nr:GGDEF domain-containing protein [Alteromonas mediterranea]APD92437.1 hypothetical protein BM524_21280 [Alteromonas mediterranea]APE00298.1 hypothetical protein BM525_21500 [Alteromonas mediterranea]